MFRILLAVLLLIPLPIFANETEVTVTETFNDQQINTLVQRRSELRKLYVQNSSPDIDGALAFWYGDFYTPITPVGKQIYTKYYGGQQLFTNVQGIGTTFIPR